MSLSSSAVVSLALLEDHSRVSEAMITGDYNDCSTSLPSSIAQTFPFSSGNPRIEETRGVMRLFTNDDISGLPLSLTTLFLYAPDSSFFFRYYFLKIFWNWIASLLRKRKRKKKEITSLRKNSYFSVMLIRMEENLPWSVLGCQTTWLVQISASFALLFFTANWRGENIVSVLIAFHGSRLPCNW